MSRRYPFAPLAAAMGMTPDSAARALRLSGSSSKRYRAEGMTEPIADRLAVKAGLHPFEVWPDMAEHVALDAYERKLATNRRWRARNAAAETERSRRYYAECREYLLAQERARYARNREAILARKREQYRQRRAA